MIRLEIRLEIRHCGVLSLCAIKDKTAIVVVASYHSVSRNPVRFKALGFTLTLPETGNQSFYVYTDIIKSQYHGDVVVPLLRTVTVKGEHGSYVGKNFEEHIMFL